MVDISIRYVDEILPKYWYNIIPDLPKPLPPPVDPLNHKSRIDLLRYILPKKFLTQQFTIERFVKIPDDVREKYEIIGRPTPLCRAVGLERYLNTPAKIYFKFEGVLPTGSHKVNTAIPQVYFAYEEGVNNVTTETGAGQWGAAVALATSMIHDVRASIFMVRVSYEHKPGRVALMEFYGADVIPSPSKLTKIGKEILERDVNHPGSLGIAISEAIEYALENNYKYVMGSVLDAVLTHQTVIGLETIKQLEIIGVEPDIVIACVGGGSNFGGFAYPFIGLKNNVNEFIAAASAEVPKFSKGSYKYDHPDTAGLLPLLKMITLGKDFTPPPIYSGGLRYHGLSPSLSLLITEGLVKYVEYSESEILEAARTFVRTQGIIPAPESAHAIKAVIDEALKAKKDNEDRVIVFNLSGHGLLDIENYKSMMVRYKMLRARGDVN